MDKIRNIEQNFQETKFDSYIEFLSEISKLESVNQEFRNESQCLIEILHRKYESLLNVIKKRIS